MKTEHRKGIYDGEDFLIPLGICAKDGYTVIDKDFSRLDKYNRYLKRGYVARTGANKETIRLHHLIVGKPYNKLVVDHISRDKLDNRKNNLRIVDHSINNINKGIRIDNKSGIKGVSFAKNRNCRVSKIEHLGKQYSKCFNNMEDAIVYRKKLEKRHFLEK